ncbi:alpha-amylase family glycosyl hydrolase [Kallotenue papyrolyticum]|uniref:alpha-amylase family glycosyl hydrolase n=1 Tax=Kallotenue papyrolyticum TaxID=1325125 RepID=UPI0004722A33|nr:alpha-amylase family glycosyl hydrolase [Kallotenue papyrolyticum]
MTTTTDVTQDFIFGTLATDELRLAALRAAGRGVYHGQRIAPADPEPGQPVTITVSTGTEVDADEVLVFYTLDGSDPGPESAQLRLQRGAVVWDTLLWGYRQEWQGVVPAQPAGTLVRYRILARERSGRQVWAEPDAETGAPAIFGYHVDQERVPAWVRDAVIYQIFVDRFHPGAGRTWNAQARSFNDIWGGTLRGVIEQLPYLEQVGVTCLWLSPIFPSPTHHGYDATDYNAIEPRLGTLDDLRELLDAAHRRGMRVLLDFVANHASDQHPLFQRARRDAAAAERDLFVFSDWPDGYRSFFGVRSMPQFNHAHPAARRYLIDAACRWLELGVDGFRLDYANGPTHEFWSAFRAATRAVAPASFTVGEVVEAADLQRSYQGRLDGTLDFLLLQHMRAFFAFETIDAGMFESFLQRHLAYFPSDFVLPSFLDNHDMNRFLWVARGDKRRLKLAALCQFTLPHPPIIYYGTEVGLSQERDLQYPDGSRRLEESRTLMLWGDQQDRELLAFYTRLIAARRRYAGLWRAPRETLLLDPQGVVVVALTQGAQRAIVALNRTPQPRQVALAEPTRLLLASEAGVRCDGDLHLPPLSGALLLAEA